MNLSDGVSLPWRLGVGIMLLNHKDEVFVGSRIDVDEDSWQMPQGGINKGEKPEEAVLRELFEETGILSVRIIRSMSDWICYDFPADLGGRLWDGTYRGQKQLWFALRFLGEESEVNIKTLEPEFRAWKWVSPLELPALAVPFKRELYQILVKELFQPVVLARE